MQVTPTALPEVLLIEPRVHGDQRGFFYEAWNQAVFDEVVGRPVRFVQDNVSRSSQGVLRGIHYQRPNPQGKLVRCTRGAIQDVVVDLRRSSPRFLQWVAVDLTDDHPALLWVPPGFGHGFYTRSTIADLTYKVDAYYDAEGDRSVAWNDPAIGIGWVLEDEPTLSDKDRLAPPVHDAPLFD